MIKFITKEIRTWWNEPKIIKTDNPPDGAKKIDHPWFPDSYTYGPNYKTRATDVAQSAGILLSYAIFVPASLVFVHFRKEELNKE